MGQDGVLEVGDWITLDQRVQDEEVQSLPVFKNVFSAVTGVETSG